MFLVGNIYPKIQREKKKYQQTKKKKQYLEIIYFQCFKQ